MIRLAAILLLLSPLIASCQTPSRMEKIDALFAAYSEGPGAAVAVIQNGKIEFLKGYGLADVKAKTPITPDTAFDLASVTKEFTATAILILAEDGKLDLDDPLTKSCPEFVNARGVTLRNLLNHTSGLDDYIGLFARTGKLGRIGPQPSWTKADANDPTADDAIKLLAKAPLEFVPGSKFEYCNSGYVVLAQVVERVSGQRFSEFLKKRVFGKLAMKNSVLVDERQQRVSQRAHSYETKADSVDIDYTPLNRIYGDGNLNTTARDMAAWMISLGGRTILSEEMKQQAWTPSTLSDGHVTDYGFGWVVDEHNGERTVGHDGGWVGFHSSMMYFPTRKLGIVVLANVSEMPVDELVSDIADLYLNPIPQSGLSLREGAGGGR